MSLLESLSGDPGFKLPTSMFEEKKTEVAHWSTLKMKLQAAQSARATGQPDAIVIDGCAILLVVHWPNKGMCRILSQMFCIMSQVN